jgi:hypothetical protein
MAHAFKWRVLPDQSGWDIVEPINGATVATVAIPEIAALPPNVRPIALYGLKQGVADGGAKEKGSSATVRLRGMLTRFAQIAAGTWNFRDGTGTASLPDGDVYAALVALGKTADGDESRDKWRKLGAPKRAAIRRIEDVAAWLESNSGSVDAEDAMADFLTM